MVAVIVDVVIITLCFYSRSVEMLGNRFFFISVLRVLFFLVLAQQLPVGSHLVVIQ